MATDVSEATFESEVIEGSKETPSSWTSGPNGVACHAVSPVLDKIAQEREGALKLVKVNIDENQDLARPLRRHVDSDHDPLQGRRAAAATMGARPKGDIEKQLGLEPVTA